MDGVSHELLTSSVIDWLAELFPGFALSEYKKNIAAESREADFRKDMEFVDVEGFSRDNPHKNEWNCIDDKPHTSEPPCVFTTFNHFIDIKKGEGLFDDYDGYSYLKGSGSVGEYQDAIDAADNIRWASVISTFTKMKVDEGVNWWFNDEYVHIPGSKWYNNCSPAVERYSYYRDKGIYSSFIKEADSRFPKADGFGKPGKGIPNSIFFPVDNLARYWYSRYRETRNPVQLGMVMHAVQDASIPHHAAGCLGNWHGKYEDDLKNRINDWLNLSSFVRETKTLFLKWNKNCASPPVRLGVVDYIKIPKKNWSVDMLATWMALNAYRSYDETYRHFAGGYSFADRDAKNITVCAAALCMLILNNASSYLFER